MHVHKEHWKHEHDHLYITIKLYFVVKENIQQQKEIECEGLRQHLIYWKKVLLLMYFGGGEGRGGEGVW